jgi:ribosomal protein S12 methylthiotransferase accessory factor
VRSGSAFGSALSAAAGEGVYFAETPPESGLGSLGGLALSVRIASEEPAGFDIDTWAWTHCIPVVHAELRGEEYFVGPLALPGVVGCGYCARSRRTAAETAARSMEPVAEDGTSDLAADFAAARLAEELSALRTAVLEESPLLHSVIVTNARTGRSSRHRVIPLPWCRVCGGAARMPGSEPSPLDSNAEPEELLLALAGWVDPHTGIISRLVFETTAAPVVVTASPPHIRGETGALRRLPVGWGKGLTMPAAILSAVGETIERYAASLPDTSRILCRCPEGFGAEFLNPAECASYDDAQYARADFPYVRFDSEVEHPWVCGRWMSSGAPVWVPAVFAYLWLPLRREQWIFQGTSNGLAAAWDFDEAALRATFELIERDAFLAAWLTGSPGRRIAVEGLPAELREVLATLEELGAQVELYCLPDSACGTAVLALALGDGERYPGVTIGIGADLDSCAAVRQAVLELGQTGPHLQRLMKSGAAQVPLGPESVREMLDHAAYFFPRERSVAFDRLRGGTSPMTLEELAARSRPRSFRDAVAALREAGIRVALVDVTSPDVATGPFRVVRAVSPDLQPLSYGYGFERSAVPRIRKLGLCADAPPVHPIW